MGVTLSVVANESLPPEVVHGDGNADGVGVVDLVVVAHVAADKAPHSLPGWVGTKTRHFGWFAAYKGKQVNYSTLTEKLLSQAISTALEAILTKNGSAPEVLGSELGGVRSVGLLKEVWDKVWHDASVI